MNTLRVAAVQFNHLPGDRVGNLAIMRPLAENAVSRGARLVVFPECCVSGYWHLRRLDREAFAAAAEPVPDGLTTQTLLAWAKEFDASIGAGFIEVDAAGRFYNSYVVAMPDGRW